MTRVILVGGSGGVGKTTMCGMLGVAAAAAGANALVLTVDPARRLAQALGLATLHNDPTPVPDTPRLQAAMLDASASWAALVHRHTDTDTADRLTASRFFRAIADRFPSGQAYAVAEEMASLVDSGDFDIVIVDTPPIGGGSDFFVAPERIATLVAGRALRLLTGPNLPGRTALYNLTGRPALKLADRLLGGPLLADLADFLLDLRTTYDGIRDRAGHVQHLIDNADLVVVSSLDPGPLDVAERLEQDRSSQVVATVLNRVLPSSWDSIDIGGTDALSNNLAMWSNESRYQRLLLADRSLSNPIEVPLTLPEPTSLDALAGLARATGIAGLVS